MCIPELGYFERVLEVLKVFPADDGGNGNAAFFKEDPFTLHNPPDNLAEMDACLRHGYRRGHKELSGITYY